MMNKPMKQIAGAALVAAVGIFAASTSFAATKPQANGVFTFNSKKTTHTFSVRPNSWSDPAFGYQGWTHHSDWGIVRAKKGSVITIRLTSAVSGLHPAVTVWQRGGKDTAPNSYVPDHFYPQVLDFNKIGAIDEDTGEEIGDIVMKVTKWGYDKDGNSLNFTLFNPVADEIPGHLELTFEAPRSGAYMFAVGAHNPDALSGINAASRYNVDGEVIVATPQ